MKPRQKIITLLLLVTFGCTNIEERRCQIYLAYLDHEVSGTVEEKYIDNDNHARPTLVIKQFRTSTIELTTPYIVKGLFDTLRVGDQVIKFKGTPLTTVKRGDVKIELTVDKSDWCATKEN